MERIDVNWNGPEVQTTQSMVGTEITQTGSENGRMGNDQMSGFGVIENSFHSTVDSGRDSGSAADSASGSEDQFRLEKKRIRSAVPKFSTFMDESDRDSVEIEESDWSKKTQKLEYDQGVIANKIRSHV